jgi:alkylation response protein AidB-like acyl-CoA dehydrogenase
VDFAFTQEQEELRSAARGFLADHSSSEQVRRAMESELGYDPEVWKRIASELGWPAVAIPEAYDGLGLGAVELTALMEEMGRVLLCAPFFSSVCLAGNALLSAGSEEQKREFLPAIAEGRTLATVAWTGPSGAPGAAGIAATVRRQGDEFVLRGAWRFVLDGLGADLLVVAARRAGSAGEEGVSLFALPSDTPGVERCALPTMDPTRRLAEVTLRDVRVPASALMGEEGEGWRPLGQALDGAAVALAAEQVGGAQTCLDLSVAYAKERVQFGRPIATTPPASRPTTPRTCPLLPPWRRPPAPTPTSGARPRAFRSTVVSASPGSTTCTSTSSALARRRSSSATRRTTASGLRGTSDSRIGMQRPWRTPSTCPARSPSLPAAAEGSGAASPSVSSKPAPTS